MESPICQAPCNTISRCPARAPWCAGTTAAEAARGPAAKTGRCGCLYRCLDDGIYKVISTTKKDRKNILFPLKIVVIRGDIFCFGLGWLYNLYNPSPIDDFGGYLRRIWYLMGRSTINGGFSIAMLDYRRVIYNLTRTLAIKYHTML